MSKYIAERRTAGEKIYYVSLTYTGDDGKGALSHPNIIAHKRAANVMINAVHEVLGI